MVFWTPNRFIILNLDSSVCGVSVKGLGSEHVRQSGVCGDVLHVEVVEYPFPSSRRNFLHLFFDEGRFFCCPLISFCP